MVVSLLLKMYRMLMAVMLYLFRVLPKKKFKILLPPNATRVQPYYRRVTQAAILAG